MRPPSDGPQTAPSQLPNGSLTSSEQAAPLAAARRSRVSAASGRGPNLVGAAGVRECFPSMSGLCEHPGVTAHAIRVRPAEEGDRRSLALLK